MGITIEIRVLVPSQPFSLSHFLIPPVPSPSTLPSPTPPITAKKLFASSVFKLTYVFPHDIDLWLECPGDTETCKIHARARIRMDSGGYGLKDFLWWFISRVEISKSKTEKKNPIISIRVI